MSSETHAAIVAHLNSATKTDCPARTDAVVPQAKKTAGSRNKYQYSFIRSTAPEMIILTLAGSAGNTRTEIANMVKKSVTQNAIAMIQPILCILLTEEFADVYMVYLCRKRTCSQSSSVTLLRMKGRGKEGIAIICNPWYNVAWFTS